MKPSSVLKYSGWGIVDSPSESPWQTADFFFLSESVSTFSRLICTVKFEKKHLAFSREVITDSHMFGQSFLVLKSLFVRLD